MIIQCMLYLLPAGQFFTLDEELFLTLDPEESDIEMDEDQGGMPEVLCASIDGAYICLMRGDMVVMPVGGAIMLEPFGE